jgi:ATP-binding cassette subfamily C (CFTR/MRP) protein 1
MNPLGEIYHFGTFTDLVNRNDEYINSCIIGNINDTKPVGKRENISENLKEEAKPENVAAIKSESLENKKSLVIQETKSFGKIDPKILSRYLKYFGSIALVICLIISFALEQTTTILNSWWLSKAVSDDNKESNINIELYVYASLGFGICLFSSIRIVLFVFGGVKSARNIYKSMVSSLLRAPIKFYDQQLTGRILNRLVSDQSNVDSAIPSALSNVLSRSLYFGALLIILGCAFPYLLIIVAVLGIPYYMLSAFYRWSARDIRRLEAITKSPINSLFYETLKGISTIRSFEMESKFSHQFMHRLESNVRCFWNRWCTNQWVTVWLEFLGTLFTLSFSLLCVWASYSSLQLSAGLVGLLLSYAVQVPSNLGWLLKLFVQAEVEFVSLERIIEYIDLKPEEDHDGVEHNLMKSLITGSISVEGLKLKYDAESDYVLKGVDFFINAKSKVAIVGRTASGKSSLFSALLKFYPFEGTIKVDGKSFAYFDFSQIRSMVRLIPQTASLIGDTLKEALCGELAEKIDDAQVWYTLELVQMKPYVTNLEDGIHSIISQIEFSAGQKQLLCLARTILNPVSAAFCSLI